jgi:hypothetical protein
MEFGDWRIEAAQRGQDAEEKITSPLASSESVIFESSEFQSSGSI